MNLATQERKKYEKVYSHEKYREVSPGVRLLPIFKQMVKGPKRTLVDIGCGTGRASLELKKMGWKVTMMDFAANAPEHNKIRFLKTNLFGRWPDEWWRQGYCCDVMEHIPPTKVRVVLKNISKHVGRCFFSIHFQADHFGPALIGHPLHLTVRPYEWWLAVLGEFGTVKQARDMLWLGAFDVQFEGA